MSKRVNLLVIKKNTNKTEKKIQDEQASTAPPRLRIQYHYAIR